VGTVAAGNVRYFLQSGEPAAISLQSADE